MNNQPPLRFMLLDDNSGRFTRDWESEDKVDALRDLLQAGRISNEAALMSARQIVSREPDNLDAQQFLALRYWDGGMKEEAAAIWAPLFERVSALIPPDFEGQIHWGEINNRPFLRLAHGHLLGLMLLNDAKAAGKLCKRMLDWCPNDNLGVRYLQPLIDLKAKRYKAAYKNFLKTAPEMPTGWYHASRIAFLEERYITALTLLRRGILANPYIAEAITGRRALFRHLRWHLSNYADHSLAESFLENDFEGWRQEEIDFVDWAFNCAWMMKERAAAAEINEALTYEHDISVRGQFVNMSYEMDAAITEASSEPWVRKEKNRYGQEYWPWDRVGEMHPSQRDWSAEEAVLQGR